MSKIGTFNYPGGKTTIADWIIDYLPEHEVYVEPFGGSAGVLANKDESPLEVYNDTASLCVDFFRALKHRPDELQHWVQTTPYSRELFDEYTQRLQQDPPEDLVERAGIFWYTQFTSFGGKGVVNTDTPSFSASTKLNGRDTTSIDYLKDAADNIQHVCDRFRRVEIEHLDFGTLFEKYDSNSVVFYCDPPYVDVGDDYYQVEEGGFDHSRFVDDLQDLDGKWLVSYDHNIPGGLEDYHSVSRGKHSSMDMDKDEKTETLIMNYNPDTAQMMKDEQQSDASDWGAL